MGVLDWRLRQRNRNTLPFLHIISALNSPDFREKYGSSASKSTWRCILHGFCTPWHPWNPGELRRPYPDYNYKNPFFFWKKGAIFAKKAWFLGNFQFQNMPTFSPSWGLQNIPKVEKSFFRGKNMFFQFQCIIGIIYRSFWGVLSTFPKIWKMW